MNNRVYYASNYFEVRDQLPGKPVLVPKHKNHTKAIPIILRMVKMRIKKQRRGYYELEAV